MLNFQRYYFISWDILHFLSIEIQPHLVAQVTSGQNHQPSTAVSLVRALNSLVWTCFQKTHFAVLKGRKQARGSALVAPPGWPGRLHGADGMWGTSQVETKGKNYERSAN